jgi:hypothetical protein
VDWCLMFCNPICIRGVSVPVVVSAHTGSVMLLCDAGCEGSVRGCQPFNCQDSSHVQRRLGTLGWLPVALRLEVFGFCACSTAVVTSAVIINPVASQSVDE